MEKFKPTNIKGAIDTLPNVQALRNKVIDVLRQNFESYGYVPIETATLNYLELLAHKYDDGAEIVREIYKLRDQGERDLGLRYDLTVPFAKFIAMNRSLKMPFRRYEIGKVWRNGPVKAGRLREFYQCDIDVVGSKELSVEAEQVALAIKCFRELGIEPLVRYGNRKLLTELIAGAGVKPADFDKVIGIIDKMEKITRTEIEVELCKFMSKSAVNELLIAFTTTKGNNEIHEFERHLEAFGIHESCIFAPYLARGLNYYTGMIWEFYDSKKRITSSLGGGGRYNNIITDWVDNGQQYPAVGMAFGLEPIMAVLSHFDQSTNEVSFVDILLVPKVSDNAVHEFAGKLREIGLKVLLWHGDKVTKGMEYADKSGIPFVTVVGEREIQSGTFNIKNMRTGSEQSFKMNEISKVAIFVRG